LLGSDYRVAVKLVNSVV